MNFFRFGSISLLLLLTVSTAQAEELKRFVLRGGLQTERLHQRARHFRARDLHHLENTDADVVEMTASDANALRKEFGRGFSIEEDAKVEALGRPHGQAWWNSPFLDEARVRQQAISQPAEVLPWGIAAVQAPEAWQYSRGAGIKVCVVDTGIQKDHPDLAANIAGGRNFVRMGGFVDKTKWNDDNGHGTHVSGTIAAIDNSIGVVGVAPLAKIYAVKVLDRNGSGYLSDVAAGIRECVTAGAHVISMSLGSSGDSSVLHDAVIYAKNAGKVIVAAAGNESGPVLYPAKYSEVWAISAVDKNLKFASFSNFGPEVDFAAPGVTVYSTVKGSGYAYYSGTSMATPHVAGIVALALSAQTNHVVSQTINGLSTDQQGYGFANAYLSVKP